MNKTIILFIQESNLKDIQLMEGDCLELMDNVPDKSVDLILADLPYGTTQNKWDSVIPLDLLWKHYLRIIKNKAPIVLFAQTPFDKVLGVSNLEMLKYEWIWEKQKATGFLNAKIYPLKAHENILVFCNGVHLYNPQKTQGKPFNKGHRKQGNASGTYGTFETYLIENKSGERLPRTVIKFNTASGGYTKRKSYHPTEKPVPLLEYMIKTYTNEGMTVLDNVMGSGSTMVACKHTNRKGIGIEKEKKYFDIAVERVENE